MTIRHISTFFKEYVISDLKDIQALVLMSRPTLWLEASKWAWGEHVVDNDKKKISSFIPYQFPL